MTTAGESEDLASDGGGATDAGLVVSEERLRAGTATVVTGRVRLVKYVVTEEVTLTVSVSREEARIEADPVPGGEGQAGAGPDAGQAPPAAIAGGPGEGWMILHAQRPVVQLESVPVERVRLRVETVTGQQEVTTQVRREQVGAPQTEDFPPPRDGPGVQRGRRDILRSFPVRCV